MQHQMLISLLLICLFQVSFIVCNYGDGRRGNSQAKSQSSPGIPGYDKEPVVDSSMPQRRGYWCSYVVPKNVSCIEAKVHRRMEKYYYNCRNGYGSCVGYRTNFVTSYVTAFKTQSTMVKDCCPGFSGQFCDKECFNCTTVAKLWEKIDELEKNQSLLARFKISEGDRTKKRPKGEESGDGDSEDRHGPPGIPMDDPNQFEEPVPGPKGVKGDQGRAGPPGPPGLSGVKGEKGEHVVLEPRSLSREGARELVGYSKDFIIGAKGAKGEVGQDGYPGQPGLDGLKGERGNSTQGPPGDTGMQGQRGPVGPPGGKGSSGLDGITGEKGSKGEEGPIGPKSIELGLPGIDGKTGPDGPKGEKGNNGEDGKGVDQAEMRKLKKDVERLKRKMRELLKKGCPCQQSPTTPGNALFQIN